MEEIPYDELPLGFRFRPTDEQLINHYLKRKINGTIQTTESWVIPDIDMCKTEPWDLPSKWRVKSSDLEWFFFAAVDRKFPSGNRTNRATEKGYWKATGKDRLIKSKKVLVGMKKTLVFHIGRAPRGIGSCWIMHEYRVVNPDGTDVVGDQGAFVLCRLFKKEKETSTEQEKEADIMKEEFTTPMSQTSPNVDLLDETHSINPENTYGQVTENNMANDEVLPYLVPTTKKPEQSHSNSDITTNVGNHHELRINQEEDSLFDGLKDFLGSDYELFSSAEAPQDYTTNKNLFDQQLFTHESNLMGCSTSEEYCAIDESFTSDMGGEISRDSDNPLPIWRLCGKAIPRAASKRSQRVPSEMHEPVERGTYFTSNNENLKASSSYETEINIRRRKPESSDNSISYSGQQGTAERRIKLERVKQRKMKKQFEIEPPVATTFVSHQSSSSSSNAGLTASAISPHLVKPLLATIKTDTDDLKIESPTFLQKACGGFSVPMHKIGVTVVIVTILCAGTIWLLAT